MRREIDPRVAHAIEWLKATSNPNQGFTHPRDIERLKQMANALSHYKVIENKDTIVYYCKGNGVWDDEGAKMIADYFTQAQTKKYKVEREDFEFLKSMMEREDW